MLRRGRFPAHVEIGASESPWIAFTEDGDGSSLSVYQELGSGRVATAVTQHTSFLQKLVARAQNAIREEGGASSGGSDGGSGAGGGGGARSARGGGRSPAPGLPQLGELIADGMITGLGSRLICLPSRARIALWRDALQWKVVTVKWVRQWHH